MKKLKNRKFKKPYIKVVRDSCLWDFGRWEWREIILELIPLEFHRIWSHKTQETCIFLLFSQYFILGLGPIKVDDLLTSPINHFRDYFIRNRLKKLVPVINITSPKT